MAILAAIMDDVTDTQQRHNPYCLPCPVDHDRLSIYGEIFPKYYNTAKTQGRGPDHPPPRPPAPFPLYLSGGISLRVRPRVNKRLV